MNKNLPVLLIPIGLLPVFIYYSLVSINEYIPLIRDMTLAMMWGSYTLLVVISLMIFKEVQE